MDAKGRLTMFVRVKRVLCAAWLCGGVVFGAPKHGVALWEQKPVVRPPVRAGVSRAAKPTDACDAA